jgi:hypothetical protein
MCQLALGLAVTLLWHHKYSQLWCHNRVTANPRAIETWCRFHEDPARRTKFMYLLWFRYTKPYNKVHVNCQDKRKNTFIITLNLNSHISKNLSLISTHFFPNVATVHRSVTPHYQSFTITLRHSTLGRILLNERSARWRDLYLTKHTTHKKQTSVPRWIRTCSPIKRTAANRRHRPRGH